MTPQEKAQNRTISRSRIGIEHAIGDVKGYGIVREVLQNLRAGFEDVVMEIACGLHHLRLDYPLTA